jgi:hypothetical protein
MMKSLPSELRKKYQDMICAPTMVRDYMPGDKIYSIEELKQSLLECLVQLTIQAKSVNEDTLLYACDQSGKHQELIEKKQQLVVEFLSNKLPILEAEFAKGCYPIGACKSHDAAIIAKHLAQLRNTLIRVSQEILGREIANEFHYL